MNPKFWINVEDFLKFFNLIKDQERKFNIEIEHWHYYTKEEYAGLSDREKIKTPIDKETGQYIRIIHTAYMSGDDETDIIKEILSKAKYICIQVK
jgi:hypothetical protein